MDTFFSAPIWGFIATVATLISILPLLRAIFDTPSKALGFTNLGILSDSSIKLLEPDDVEAERKNFVQILRITNTGKTVIDETDFARPLLLSYDETCFVRDVLVIEDKHNIKPHFTLNEHSVEFKEMLNAGDTMIVGIVLAATKMLPRDQDCRIKGGQALDAYDPGFWWSERVLTLLSRYIYTPLAVIAGLVSVYLIARAQNDAGARAAIDAVNGFGVGILVTALVVFVLTIVVTLATALRLKIQGHLKFRKLRRKLGASKAVPDSIQDQSAKPAKTRSDEFLPIIVQKRSSSRSRRV